MFIRNKIDERTFYFNEILSKWIELQHQLELEFRLQLRPSIRSVRPSVPSIRPSVPVGPPVSFVRSVRPFPPPVSSVPSIRYVPSAPSVRPLDPFRSVRPSVRLVRPTERPKTVRQIPPFPGMTERGRPFGSSSYFQK